MTEEGILLKKLFLNSFFIKPRADGKGKIVPIMVGENFLMFVL